MEGAGGCSSAAKSLGPPLEPKNKNQNKKGKDIWGKSDLLYFNHNITALPVITPPPSYLSSKPTTNILDEMLVKVREEPFSFFIRHRARKLMIGVCVVAVVICKL